MTSPRAASPTGTSSSLSLPRILIVFGTRPEAIKLCPLVQALAAHRERIEPVVCVTAQHRGMLDQILNAFFVRPDFDLDVMTPGQTLPTLTSRLIAGLEPVLATVRPSMLVVQGDTTTTLCGALCGFYARIPVAHVEAGLRTGDMTAPFPEEMNRIVTGRLAALHFAPTQWAADNLLREGVPAGRVEVTGNTGIDAVLSVKAALEAGKWEGVEIPLDARKKLVVVTAHRRENFGDAFVNVCEAVAEIASRPDVQVVWPVHPNPNVRSVVERMLRGTAVVLTEPLSYIPFVDLLRRATVLLTDSGGIQEEAPSLGKPVLVLREKTERPEAVAAGTVKLVGSDPAAIVRECNRLLDHPEERARMARVHNPYGDGHASKRIAQRIVDLVCSDGRL